ncbi:unnamed protein product [Kuraishia capsulata CBS 1993]|uniref:Major facilitator superfamily (MFS) profile domain-containing protein n=1 Tax=Kuraishia capsulata CBS 1993 TaxID=1382522 RepID=W6MIB3_9ASCO|nr:uncharacterized protein KUCA_T00000032001 [Kuraishia capsulata CBS 1993]CDK24072.1 unnamed protein product [Kuraishia capsulata CBS 1993]
MTNEEKAEQNMVVSEQVKNEHGSDISSGVLVIEADELYIDPVKEKKLVHKLDWFLLPMFSALYFLSFLDRSNIGNAKIAGMYEQLDLTPNQYSAAVSVFYATYITAELPSVLLVKRVGPRLHLTVLVVCWSLVTIFTAFIRDYWSLILTRLLLGLFEGGFFPCLSLIISMTYKREEQSRRLGYLYVCSCFSGAFGGLIATGITKIKPRHNFQAWCWLYIIEGCISLAVASWVIFGMPNDVKKAKFLTKEEQEMMAIRFTHAQKYQGNQNFEKKELVNALKDPKVYLSLSIQFCVDLVLYGFSTFLPSILKLQLGYDSMQAQYLSVPVYMFAAIAVFSTSYVSDKKGWKAPIILGCNAFGLIGYCILLGSSNGPAKYFACYLIAIPYYSSVGVGVTWINNNMAPHYRRASALGLNQTFGNLAGVIAGQVYRTAPYKLGNGFSLGCTVVAMVLTTIQYYYLKSQNTLKAKILAGEIEDTRREKTGSNAPDFVYIL